MSGFFDLQKELTTNRDFGNKIQKLMRNITLAEKAGSMEALREAVTDLLRACHWNPSLLVPYYFPAYPKDKPMTLWSRPHAFAMMMLQANAQLTIQASRQTGKCSAWDTKLTIRELDGSNVIQSYTTDIKTLFDNAKKDVKKC